MRIVVQYFEGCPHAQLASDRVREALRVVGMPHEDIVLSRIEGPEQADAVAFRGSPTILLDGADPFGDEDAAVGYACRVYVTEGGPDGAPSVPQLVQVLRSAPPAPPAS